MLSGPWNIGRQSLLGFQEHLQCIYRAWAPSMSTESLSFGWRLMAEHIHMYVHVSMLYAFFFFGKSVLVLILTSIWRGYASPGGDPAGLFNLCAVPALCYSLSIYIIVLACFPPKIQITPRTPHLLLPVSTFSLLYVFEHIHTAEFDAKYILWCNSSFPASL